MKFPPSAASQPDIGVGDIAWLLRCFREHGRVSDLASCGSVELQRQELSAAKTIDAGRGSRFRTTRRTRPGGDNQLDGIKTSHFADRLRRRRTGGFRTTAQTDSPEKSVDRLVHPLRFVTILRIIHPSPGWF